MSPHPQALANLVGPCLPVSTTEWGVHYSSTRTAVTVTMEPPTNLDAHVTAVLAWTTHADLEAAPVTTAQLRGLLEDLGMAGAQALETMTYPDETTLSTAYRALAAASSP